ncbi:hypothetical protein FIBSPDRAFT_497481 [Athelia psychrophila]|uniref:Uncharacterized protein n=1 Tax=Athelia psychrophila TaxID=1759441 RepID=A0A166KE19_9AGAM|nr:hypothetical protein FIBSPDRAFT_497481 [Fibularhizoctonia sp. CBS 109695]
MEMHKYIGLWLAVEGQRKAREVDTVRTERSKLKGMKGSEMGRGELTSSRKRCRRGSRREKGIEKGDMYQKRTAVEWQRERDVTEERRGGSKREGEIRTVKPISRICAAPR